MAHKDFRSFLQALEEEGQLLRIQEPVLPEPDIGAAASAANKGLGETAPALLFENIKGYTKANLATNVHGSWPNMAIALGLPKATPALVASMPILYDQDEYNMCAALIEEDYPVLSLPNKLQVPWGSEYVLEGKILPGAREQDGPYGEFTGHLSGIRLMNSIEITKVSHRKDPTI